MGFGRFALRFLAATLVSLLAFYLNLGEYFDLPEADLLVERNVTIADAFYSNNLSQAVSAYDASSGQYVWGRTTSPHFSMDLYNVNWVLRYMQMKEFVWFSVTSGDWLIGVAVLQFHYMSTLTMQVLRVGDRDDGTDSPSTVRSLRGRLDVPLVSELTHTGGVWTAGANGGLGPASAGHTVQFRPPPWSRSPSYVNLTFTGDTIELFARTVVTDAPRTLAGAGPTPSDTRQYVVELKGTAGMPVQWMGLVFPVGVHRPAMVQKMAAVPLVRPAQLTITPLGKAAADAWPTKVNLKDAYFSMDYTRGVLRRRTEWLWASVSAPCGVGLHLSANTYDVHNVSMESTIFDTRDGRGGTTTFLNEAVQFVRLPTTRKVQWAVRSTNGTVSLVFTAHGGHDGAVDARVVKVNLDHQWGTFRGKVRLGEEVVVFEDVPGVFEEHFALW